MVNRVGRVPYPGIEGASVLFSARSQPNACNGLEYTLSFVFDAGDVTAEWEPRYGPIALFYRSDDPTHDEHYLYPRAKPNCGDWSQLAVEREGLPGMFLQGDYAGIFRVLASWARDRQEEERANEA